jgi:hypothetical protein
MHPARAHSNMKVFEKFFGIGLLLAGALRKSIRVE